MNDMIPFADLHSMAKAVQSGGCFPTLRNVDQAVSLLLLAQAEGIHPIMALRRFHIMSDGKPSMRADAMAAGFRKIGGDIEWLNEADDGKAQYANWTLNGRTKRIGFTWAEAEKAGYTAKAGTNWHKDPASMLRARATSRAIRMMAPEIVVGLYTPEEMDELSLENAAAPRTTKASKQAPEQVTATVVSSEPGKGAATAAASVAAQAAAPAANVDPNEPTDEVARLKYLRGKFNQELLAVKTGDDFKKARGSFERAHGKDFMAKLTGHNATETFMSLLTTHWQRIEPILRNAKWRSDVGTAFDVATFRSLEKRFFDGEVDQSAENEAAINAKGIALKLAEYTGGASSDSSQAAQESAPLQLEEDINAQQEG